MFFKLRLELRVTEHIMSVQVGEEISVLLPSQVSALPSNNKQHIHFDYL